MIETNLQLSIGGLPPLSARGCSEILSCTPLGEMKRTINGELIFMGKEFLKKYSSMIKGKDKTPPALEGLTRGQKITVSCLSYFTQKFILKRDRLTAELERISVLNSIHAITDEQKPVPISMIQGRKITFSPSELEEQAVYISYRPQLEMIVLDFATDTDEWNLTCGWHLKLEEV